MAKVLEVAPSERLLKRTEAAAYLAISHTMVRKLDADGVLLSIQRPGPRGKPMNLYRFADLERFAIARAAAGRRVRVARAPNPNKVRAVWLTSEDVTELLALGCGNERGELDGPAVVAVVRRLRERLREIRASLASRSSPSGAQLDDDTASP